MTDPWTFHPWNPTMDWSFRPFPIQRSWWATNVVDNPGGVVTEELMRKFVRDGFQYFSRMWPNHGRTEWYADYDEAGL